MQVILGQNNTKIYIEYIIWMYLIMFIKVCQENEYLERLSEDFISMDFSTKM